MQNNINLTDFISEEFKKIENFKEELSELKRQVTLDRRLKDLIFLYTENILEIYESTLAEYKEKKSLKVNPLYEFIYYYNQLNRTWENFNLLFDCANGKLHELSWKIFDQYLNLISFIIGDENEWLHWFIYENRAGKKEMEITIDNVPYKITNIHQLYDLVIKK